MDSLILSFENAISCKSYDELKSRANEILPGKLIFPELPFPDEESIYIYNNIMLISVLIAAPTIINFALLYDFIFKKRRRQLAIMRICGCTPLRAWGICLGECCTVCVPVFLLGIINPWLALALLGILALYLAFSMIMPLLMIGTTTPKQLLQEQSGG